MQVLRNGPESRKPTQCIKIANACNKIWSQKLSQCIKIGNACIKMWNRVFSEQISALWDFFEKNLADTPARLNITPADKKYAFG